MKWSKKRKAYVEELISYWLQEFGLLPLTMDLKFHDKPDTSQGFEASMKVLSHYPYRSIEWHVYPSCQKDDEERLTRTILHEMIHLVLWKYRVHTEQKELLILEEDTCDLLSHVVANALFEKRV